ncbi:MAG TPA: D-sedoheptulose 7-phosphate isomerase [bacterium]|nr:D-sedoheptulose 7-phosphate isomerase [bacterium]HMW35092.1 D-sedoheptulose 7-phosphate isomerase [bacterium]HMY35121.1 D-sedoheptulose 7-phosphate isomerase [bacterium]HMZ04357.1 D-sedoheptulose 7-phosphate isomerase [bacterium]HNB09139.1 D-sedoheptulose 7-phosphate isomerase [bacterium]
MRQDISSRIKESITTKEKILSDEVLIANIEKVTDIIISAFRSGHRLYLCGNGGSAADAQHIAAELSGRFYYDRKPLYAEALHVNSSYVTAVANDYGYDVVYERMVDAAGQAGDVLIGISTSGNSPNVVKALQKAKVLNMHTVGMTGANGGVMKGICDILINIPSKDTPRIQECHILVGHILCELIEQTLFPKPK